jgi:hypothetical protein
VTVKHRTRTNVSLDNALTSVVIGLPTSPSGAFTLFLLRAALALFITLVQVSRRASTGLRPSIVANMPHRRCVVCDRVVPARGHKRVYPEQCLLLMKQGVAGNAICTTCYDIHHRASQTAASALSDEAKEYDAARAKVVHIRTCIAAAPFAHNSSLTRKLI